MADLKKLSNQELLQKLAISQAPSKFSSLSDAEIISKLGIEQTPQRAEPMLDPKEFMTQDIFATPKGLTPVQSAVQTAKRGMGSALGSFVPGGEITAKRPEMAARTAGAILAPVGSLTGLAGEKIGKELAPEGKEGLGRAIGGITGGIAGEGAVMGARKLAGSAAGKIINSILKPKTAAFKYGRNPGKTVAKLGIVGNSVEDFGQNIGKTIQTKLDDLGNILKVPQNVAKKINYTKAVNILDDTIDDLGKSPKMNKTIISKMQDLKDDLLALATKTGKKNIKKLTPEEALNMKRVTGNAAKWTGTDTPAEFQGLIHKMYHAMRKAMEKAIPETAQINDDIANLIGAQRAIPGAVARAEKAGPMGLFKLRTALAGGAGALLGGGTPGAVAGIAAEKIASSPPVATRAARTLAKFGRNPGKLLSALGK